MAMARATAASATKSMKRIMRLCSPLVATSSASSCSSTTVSSSTSDDIFDVIVIGGGIIGASTAQEMARRGKKVLLLERFALGHGHGSSHGDGRILRLAYPESSYLHMCQLSYHYFADIERQTDTRLVVQTGGIDVGRADTPSLIELEGSLREHNVPYEALTATQAAMRFPQFNFPADSRVLYQPDYSVVLADAAVAACWRLAERYGARMIQHVHVTKLDATTRAHHVIITSNDARTWIARQVIVAAGGWSAELLKTTGCNIDLVVSREQVAYFPPRQPYPYDNAALSLHTAPIGGDGAVAGNHIPVGTIVPSFTHITAPTMTPSSAADVSSQVSSLPVNHNAGVFPIFLFHPHPSVRPSMASSSNGDAKVDIDALYHDRFFYGLSQTIIGGVKCGLHFGGEVVTTPDDTKLATSSSSPSSSLHGNAIRTAASGLPIDERNLQLLQERVRDTLPHLDWQHPVLIDHCHYTSSNDRHFILDRHPIHTNQIFIATAGSGHAFKFGPLIGVMMSDMMMNRTMVFDDRSLFGLQRFQSRTKKRTGA